MAYALDINALPEPDPLLHGLEGNVLKLGRDWLKSITNSHKLDKYAHEP